MTNRRQDGLLRERAEQAVGDGAESTDALAAILQRDYPRVVVHRHELSGERKPLRHVYRVRNWIRVGSMTGGEGNAG